MTDLPTLSKLRDVERVACFDEAANLAYAYYLETRRKAASLAESVFLLGAAVARAESLSSYGDAFYAVLSDDLGVSARLLRRAVKWYDLCADYDGLQRLIAGDDDLSMRSMAALISENSGRVERQREHRRYVGRMRAAGKTPRLEAPKLPPVQRNGSPSATNDGSAKRSFTTALRRRHYNRIRAAAGEDGTIVGTLERILDAYFDEHDGAE